jgi:hypothetical protein
MTDVVLPRPTPPFGLMADRLIKLLALLLLALLVLLGLRWSAILSDSATCERTGAFSPGFSRGFDVSRCKDKFFGFAEARPTSGTFGQATFYSGY